MKLHEELIQKLKSVKEFETTIEYFPNNGGQINIEYNLCIFTFEWGYSNWGNHTDEFWLSGGLNSVTINGCELEYDDLIYYYDFDFEEFEDTIDEMVDEIKEGIFNCDIRKKLKRVFNAIDSLKEDFEEEEVNFIKSRL